VRSAFTTLSFGHFGFAADMASGKNAELGVHIPNFILSTQIADLMSNPYGQSVSHYS
jgi:hypothetical protein